ncbi:MAG: hypothetical protein H8D56_26860 [Planctomycetes bacterium]|nr:hypothetical protein [Planctomycetota bacterium]
MSTRLDRLLKAIHPDITLRPIFDRAGIAVNSFPFPDVIITQFDQFKYLLVRFSQHLEAKIFRIESMPEMGVDFHWSRCYQILRQIYGVNCEKTAFDMIRTNKAGGLREVIKQFTDTVVQNYAAAEINAKISFYINDLSVPEKIAAGKEYVQKYGHLLPNELTESTAVRIHANFAKVLEKHVFMVYHLAKSASKL